MSNFSINRPPDVVTVLWQRNPLQDYSPRMIVNANVIGSAEPCPNLLSRGERFSRASECLLENRFKIVYRERFGAFGVAVFIRKYN
jgi:hypothetical protein